MHQARSESTQDRALTHTFGKYSLALVAVCSFGFGVLVRDVAQDYRDAKLSTVLSECHTDRENAALYAKALVALLNGHRVSIPGAVLSCKTKQVNS